MIDLEPGTIDLDNLRAVIRDKAFNELPEVFTLKERPTFNYTVQYFLVPQAANDKMCLAKHYYVKDDKIKAEVATSTRRPSSTRWATVIRRLVSTQTTPRARTVV
jgi:hypothetical protein